jgi:AcrR family transcriptional regulator
MTRAGAVPADVERGAQPLRSDAARNRQRLLEAAAEVFAERGLEAGVEEVARVAGVGMGTLYRRFPTKEALIDELVGELLVDLLSRARGARGVPGGQGLEGFLHDVGELQSARLGCLPRLWNTAQHADIQAEIRAATTALLTDAQRHGRVRSDVVPADVYAVMWSLRGVIEMTRATAPDAWERHLEIILLGMRPSDKPLERAPMSRAAMTRLVERLPV